MVNEKTQKLINKLVKKWDTVKVKHFMLRPAYGSEFDSAIGRIWWNNPNFVWIYTSDNEEDYGGSQEQLGLTRDGKIFWEYQSHCSCNGYEDSTSNGTAFDENSLKSWELSKLPPDWEIKIQENIKKLLE